MLNDPTFPAKRATSTFYSDDYVCTPDSLIPVLIASPALIAAADISEIARREKSKVLALLYPPLFD